MKITTAADALQSANGLPLEAVEGILTQIWDQNTGVSSEGKPYSLQNGTLKDDTGEIKIVFSGHDPIPKDMKGELIHVASVSGKNGLTGVKIKDNNYKGTVTKQVWITPTGKISFPNKEGYQAQTGSVERVTPSVKPVSSSNSHHSPVASKVSIDPEVQCRTRIAQLAKMHLICAQTADESLKDHGYAIEERAKVAMALFIQACRENLSDKLKVEEVKDDIQY